MSVHRDLRNAPIVSAVKLLVLWAGLLYGRRLSDPHTCYKLLSTKLMNAIDLPSLGFELSADINAKLLRRKVPIKEIPASYKVRLVAEGKKIRWQDFFHAAWVDFRQRW